MHNSETKLSSENLKEKQIHPLKNANFFSKLFFIWLFPLFYKGYSNNLSEDDVYPVLKEQESKKLGNRIEKEWENELKENTNPSLWKVLMRIFGLEMIGLGAWYMTVEIIIRLAQPIVLSKLLEYYEPNTSTTKSEAYFYSTILVLSSGLTALSQHHFMYFQFNLGIKIRIATSAIVYRKSLKLSKAALINTNVGQMVNLISNDVARFEIGIRHIHNLWLAPLELIIIMILLYYYVGPASFAGVMVYVTFMPLLVWLGKKTSVFRLNIAMKTDERIRLMNEIVSGIQIIKMYTWEKPFAKLVAFSRRQEMEQIRKASIIRAILMSFHLFINRTAICLSVLTYVLTGHILNTQYVYVVTSFCTILRIIFTMRFAEGATQIAEASISVRRIKEFLMKDEIESKPGDKVTCEQNGNNVRSTDIQPSLNCLHLKDISVKWNTNLDNYSLSSINMDLHLGELAVIIGPVGSGKSTLLHTILREITPISGKVIINGSLSYASQEPWLFSGTIRQNIIFGQSFNLNRYNEVLRVCCLESDLEAFPFGDGTLIGDRGVTLSGGQKARINLARAIYKQADIYLLDDPLSAVDTRVGNHIFKECFETYLKSKCVILVTHQLQYLKNVDKIYLMDDGKIDFFGNYEQVRTCGKEFAQLFKNFKEEVDDEEGKIKLKKLEGESKMSENKKTQKVVQEGKDVGSVSWNVYKSYISSGGHWCKILGISCLFLVSQILALVSDYYLTWWVNAEALKQFQNDSNSENFTTEQESITTIQVSPFQQFWITYMTDDINLIASSLLVATLIILGISRSISIFQFCMTASTKLHDKMFGRIVYATMRFFNTNPSGRILNRFSRDMNQVDESLPTMMIDTIQNGSTALFTAIIIATVNPWMIIPAVIIVVIFYFLRVIYVRTSRDVKRLEGISRSPVYSHLAASIQGITTIRAFQAEHILRDEFDMYQNRNSSTFLMGIALHRCFGLWLDAHCVIYIFFVTMSFLVFESDQGILGGFVGLSITQSLTLTGMFQWCIRQWGELENAMVSVERINEYVEINPEKDESSTKEPPAKWPNEGKITFDNLSLKYADDGPKVLNNLSFLINAKDKIGIVGRTGAGKSSIIAALFRLAETDGTISIDEVNIHLVALRDLRSRISIIPQEPVLFSGTLRKNLDPFDEHNDEVLWRALHEVELSEAINELPRGLESQMTEGGTNFSVGQRQLICLARALIKRNKILVMDEATANVDPQTDALIQTTIRKKFSNCTVLTIAHRLNTVIDSDKILVMDAGCVVEFGRPDELLENHDGPFYQMVQHTGKAMAEMLIQISRNDKKSPDQTLGTNNEHQHYYMKSSH